MSHFHKKNFALCCCIMMSICFAPLLRAQNLAWLKHAGGTEAEEGRVIATDAQGNSYVTGYFVDKTIFGKGKNAVTLEGKGWWDVFVAKYSPQGELIFAKSIGGTGWEEGRGIVADAQGNCYVTGYFHDTAYVYERAEIHQFIAKGQDDVFVVKFSPEGQILWAVTAGGTSNDYSNSISADVQGNLYLTGSYEKDATFGEGEKAVTLTNKGMFDTFVAKYDSQGKLIFATSANGLGNEYGNDIVPMPDGSSYITGTFDGQTIFSNKVTLTSAGGEDIFIAKYSSKGALEWAKSIGGAGKDDGNSIIADKAGNIYVAGSFSETIQVPMAKVKKLKSAGATDIVLISLASDGKIKYAWAGGGIGNDYANGITLSENDRIAITGNFEHEIKLHSSLKDHHVLRSSGGFDVFIIYSNTQNGEIVSARSFGGKDNEYANSIISWGNGTCFITGSMRGKVPFKVKNNLHPEEINSAGDWDVLLIKLY